MADYNAKRYITSSVTRTALGTTYIQLDAPTMRCCSIRRRAAFTCIREASRFVPLERLAVNPQCGFSNSVMGSAITPADEERKLRLIVETAWRVSGEDTALLPDTA
jgi:hypothetical protein